MLNIEDLWIGDLLRLKKSGRIGKYAGNAGLKIKIKVGEKIILTTIGNLEEAPEEQASEPNFIARPTLITQTPKTINATIDLHIEVLNPSLTHARAERIIDVQVKAAEDFIKNAIKQRLPKIEIIHGKGTGVLKSEVDHLIYLYRHEIKAQFPLNQGGSVEIWFINP